MLSEPICLRVKGPFACFTRPEFHVERVSYPVITPSAARGILEAILMKPMKTPETRQRAERQVRPSAEFLPQGRSTKSFMAREIFVDSSGLYALADRRDPHHPQTEQCVRELACGAVRLLLTDFILDEAATLAKVRAGASASLKLLEIVERSAAFSFAWITPEF